MIRMDSTGEIQVRSQSVMAGYLPDADTAAAFKDGWYRTGDIGYLDNDGWLYITDRVKEMVKVRGFQVAPAEIEAVLLGHPAVADCAVFGVPDGIDGEAMSRRSRPKRPSPLRSWWRWLPSALASYKRPRDIVFVPQIRASAVR